MFEQLLKFSANNITLKRIIEIRIFPKDISGLGVSRESLVVKTIFRTCFAPLNLFFMCDILPYGENLNRNSSIPKQVV